MVKVVAKKKKFKVTKKNAAKAAAAVGIVGLGAALFAKREKIKKVFQKFFSKVKKTA